MELGPIPGIRAIGPRVREAVMPAPSIVGVDRGAQPGDRIVQRANRKGAGAEENAEEEPVIDGEAGEEEAEKSVDYFA